MPDAHAVKSVVFQAVPPRVRLREMLDLDLVRDDAVLAVLRGRADISAVEAADVVGVARVTARRYLEHFVETGRAAVRHNYETGGRPERRYRAT